MEASLNYSTPYPGREKLNSTDITEKTRRVLKKDKASGRRWCELVIESIWGIRNGEVYIYNYIFVMAWPRIVP